MKKQTIYNISILLTVILGIVFFILIFITPLGLLFTIPFGCFLATAITTKININTEKSIYKAKKTEENKKQLEEQVIYHKNEKSLTIIEDLQTPPTDKYKDIKNWIPQAILKENKKNYLRQLNNATLNRKVNFKCRKLMRKKNYFIPTNINISNDYQMRNMNLAKTNLFNFYNSRVYKTQSFFLPIVLEKKYLPIELFLKLKKRNVAENNITPNKNTLTKEKEPTITENENIHIREKDKNKLKLLLDLVKLNAVYEFSHWYVINKQIFQDKDDKIILPLLEKIIGKGTVTPQEKQDLIDYIRLFISEL